MQTLRILSATILMLAISSSAYAGPKLVTGYLTSTAVGFFTCLVTNASATKDVEVTITTYSLTGTMTSGPTDHTILPNSSGFNQLFNFIHGGHCVIEVRKGGKKNVRGHLMIYDADNPNQAISVSEAR